MYLIKKRCVDYLGGRCKRCGYDRCNKAMTFHQRDPAAKEFTTSQMRDRASAVLSAELDKCGPAVLELSHGRTLRSGPSCQ